MEMKTHYLEIDFDLSRITCFSIILIYWKSFHYKFMIILLLFIVFRFSSEIKEIFFKIEFSFQVSSFGFNYYITAIIF